VGTLSEEGSQNRPEQTPHPKTRNHPTRTILPRPLAGRKRAWDLRRAAE
jgi:hypothetical protein